MKSRLSRSDSVGKPTQQAQSMLGSGTDQLDIERVQANRCGSARRPSRPGRGSSRDAGETQTVWGQRGPTRSVAPETPLPKPTGVGGRLPAVPPVDHYDECPIGPKLPERTTSLNASVQQPGPARNPSSRPRARSPAALRTGSPRTISSTRGSHPGPRSRRWPGSRPLAPAKASRPRIAAAGRC